MSLPSKTTSNNPSDIITLNIYNNQKNNNEESEANINDTQVTQINNLNKNNAISKKSVMQLQNNYLYLDNIRGNNYPYSDNLRNQMYSNYNLNAYNQYGYNGQNNAMINMNNNSPNGNPVKIVDPNIQANEENSQIIKKRPKHSKKSIICMVVMVVICAALAISLTASIK